jgi:hypothetical protein
LADGFPECFEWFAECFESFAECFEFFPGCVERLAAGLQCPACLEPKGLVEPRERLPEPRAECLVVRWAFGCDLALPPDTESRRGDADSIDSADSARDDFGVVMYRLTGELDDLGTVSSRGLVWYACSSTVKGEISTFGDVKGMVRGLPADLLQDLLAGRPTRCLERLLEGLLEALLADSMGVIRMVGLDRGLPRGLPRRFGLWARPATRLMGRPADWVRVCWVGLAVAYELAEIRDRACTGVKVGEISGGPALGSRDGILGGIGPGETFFRLF